MRRSLAKFPAPVIGNVSRNAFVSSNSSFVFSTSADGGAGGGRGRGSGSPNSRFSIGNAKVDDKQDSKDERPIQSGVGRGRGRVLPVASSSSPSSTSFVSGVNPNPTSSGRGRDLPTSPPPPPQAQHSGPVKKPIFFLKEQPATTSPADSLDLISKPLDQSKLRSALLSEVLSPGVGRGTSIIPPVTADVRPKEENRHLRARKPDASGDRAIGENVSPSSPAASPSTPRFSRKEASERGRRTLPSDDRGTGRPAFRGRGRGFAQGRGRGRGRDRGRGRGRRDVRADDDDYGSGLYLGDNADGEKLANGLGPENMNKLVEAFEEMSGSVLPSPVDDAYLDGLHTNLLIELEPEYMMEEFGTNPDIDDTPPIPLREALEKMKPFLMAYEGIQSQEEWEEVMKETMEKAPLLKEIVDQYSGPDRVTAKAQQAELERVAKTIPTSAPQSVKRFTERAVLSLQSNPGWGFDKKCQFMDKLAWEVSQQYK